MKTKIAVLMLLSIGVLSCEKEKKEEQTSPPSLVGKWETQSLRYQSYEDNQLEMDTTIYAPYSGFLDPIRSVEFTNDSVIITESSFTISLKYQRVGNIILASDEDETDTLFTIDNLTAQNFDFSYIEEYTDQVPVEKYVYKYRSNRK